MSRILKRVPMDFDWPIGKVWEGYLSKPEYDPPSGDGFQLWETTSDGSPMSPVFDSLEALCEWSAVNATVFAKARLSAAGWKRYLTDPKAQVSIGGIVIG